MSLAKGDETVSEDNAPEPSVPALRIDSADDVVETGRSALHTQAAPYFVLVISLLITLLATAYAEENNRAKERMRFENLVQQTDDAIQARMENYISILRGVSGLLAADQDISRARFTRYVSRLDIGRNYPGIQGVGVAGRVDAADKERWVRGLRAQGLTDFNIWPPAPVRSEYYPIVHLYPMDRRNRAAIGYDMRFEAVRRRAMLRARDEGMPIASGRVTLVQEIDEEKQFGFLIYVPVYATGDIPLTLEERRRTLRAFAYAPFRAGDLFAGIFGSQTEPRVGFSLYEGTTVDDKFRMHRSVTGDRSRFYTPSMTEKSYLHIAGMTWTVVHETTPAFERTRGGLAGFILFTGLIVSGILFAISRSQAHARAAAEETACHLRESRRALEEHEARQRLFLRDVFLGVTEGKLRLCHDIDDLPERQPALFGPMQLRKETLRELRQATRQVAQTQEMPVERLQDLLTAVGEASMNAVVHGNGGEAQVAAGPGTAVQVWIEDQGGGIDMNRLPRATLERGYTTADSLGHGFWLILRTIDRVWLLTSSEGTTVVLEQDRDIAEPSWL